MLIQGKKVIISFFSAETQNTRGYAFSFGRLDGFFLSILIPGQHIYTGAHVDTGHQSLRQEYEPACFHITQPLGFTSPGAAVGSHSCLTSGMEQASLPTKGLR